MAINTLPLVRRNSQVNKMLSGTTCRKNGAGTRSPGSASTTGRCHTAQTTPRTTLAVSAEQRDSKRGSAYPRQPISSPIGAPNGRKTKNPSNTAVDAQLGRRDQSSAPPPNSGSRTTTAPTTRIGTAIRTAYQRAPTRHRTNRCPRSPNPARPSVAATTITAASDTPPINSPSGATIGTPLNPAPTPHDSPKASAKNPTTGPAPGHRRAAPVPTLPSTDTGSPAAENACPPPPPTREPELLPGSSIGTGHPWLIDHPDQR